jgi:TPR repeat protein
LVMSSPGHDEADKQPEHPHEAESYRLQDHVIEAAQRLEREAAERAAQTPFQLNNNTVTFRIPVARRPVERPQQQDDTNERVWSALRTEFLAPPPQKGWGVPGFAMIVGAIGAVVVSAATAFVVVYMLNLSSPLATASRDDEAARNQSFSAAAANLSMVAAAQAKMQPADEPSAPTGALLAATAPSDDAAATKSPAQPPSPSPEIKPAAIESAPPPEPRAVASLPPTGSLPPAAVSPPVAASPPPAATAPPATTSAPPAAASAPPVPAPAPQPTLAMSPDEIAALLKRGRDLIAAGDVASARLVLTHLADSGVAEASFVLATTFDPAVLETLRVVGMKPDPAKAKAWYSRAADQGSLEAKQRLQALR